MGPDGVKWELEFSYFFQWENLIWVTGIGKHKPENGNRTGIWTKNSLGNGIYTTPPPFFSGS